MLCVFVTTELYAKDYSFSWSANPEPVEGYRLYYKKGGDKGPPFDGSGAVEGASPITIGKQTSFTISGLEDNTTYHFALTAFNGADESSYSGIITVFETIAPPPPAPPPPLTTGNYTFTFSWENTPGIDITAYRFYLNGKKICESTTPTDTTITCTADILNDVMSFSMAAVDNLGVESTQSNILILNPADYPEFFAKKSTTFSWDYDSAATTISGFKIYNNEGLVCETADPTTRQLTCDILLGETNVFRISAVESGVTETTPSNLISYTKETAAPGTEPLAAVITTASQTGDAPFNVTFDGTASTGPINSYSWSFGDGLTASGATVFHVYQHPGTYSATLTVTDAGGLSHQNSMTITASAPVVPPPTYTPPTAVISSSASVGEAPFTVSFDSSGSTSAQPPIVSHSWAFGDGLTAEGTAVAHTYTVAGTYHTALTVTDSVGLTNQTTTPVLISAAPVQENQQPTASFTVTPSAGKAPLTVAFEASASSDPDGSISNYVWSFGDGTSASGVSTQHTYTGIAEYTASLQVTDDKGATATSSKTVSVLAQEQATIDFELSQAQVDHTWKTFTFSKTFIDPIVIAGPPSFTDSAPSTVRIRKVTPTGFEARIEEWNYLDGIHAQETFSFITMEKGAYTLDNGAKIEAGKFTGSTSFQKVSLQQSYNLTPVILSQVLTINETDTVTGRIRNSGLSSFEYKMQEQDKNVQHKAETIGYIAWEPGKGEYAGLHYESGLTAQSVTHNWFDLTFQSEFPELPLFLAGMQTSAEADAAAIRLQTLSKTSAQIKIEEEQSKDAETSHAAEVAGYLALSAAPPTPPPIEEMPLSTDKKFSFTWEYGDTQNVGGFKIFLNNTLLCETTNPNERQLTCQSPLLDTAMEFTMKAMFLDGSESTPSGILSISPTDFPDLFGIHLTTFTWDFDSAMESSISGFRIFNDTTLICETSNPADRQLSCTVQMDANKNIFTIKALDVGGTESAASNTLLYTP